MNKVQIIKKTGIFSGLIFLWFYVNPDSWRAIYPVKYTNGSMIVPPLHQWISWFFAPTNIGTQFRHYVFSTYPDAMTHYLFSAVIFGVIAFTVDEKTVRSVVIFLRSQKNVGEQPVVVAPSPSQQGSKTESFNDHHNENATRSKATQEDFKNNEETPRPVYPPGDKNSIVVFKSVTPFDGAGEKTEIVRRFLNMVGKPYKRQTMTLEKLKAIKKILDVEYPWLKALTKEATENMEVQIRLKNEDVPMAFPPILVLGPPGVGKTDWCRRMAELSGVGYRLLTLGGKQSSATIRSSERVWSTSGPSALISTILQESIANPIIVLDEVDKVGSGDNNGNVQDTLLQLLEKSSSRNVYDDFLEGETDLSGIQWVATANDKDHISDPLLNRFKVVTVENPSPEHAPALAKSVQARIAKEWQIDESRLPDIQLTSHVKDLLEKHQSIRVITRFAMDRYSEAVGKK